MTAKMGPFTFAELQAVTCLGRGEIRECITRGIISAPAGVGQGNHRDYSKWNLVEGVIAAALLWHVRAGSVAIVMTRLRLMLAACQIDPESYCRAPEEFGFADFSLLFLPRTKLEDKAEAPLGEEIGENAFVISTARRSPTKPGGHDDRPPNPQHPSLEAFCKLPVDLGQAVRFVDHMIETKL
jgi:hypothetical protein